MSFIYQTTNTELCQHRGCLFYDLGSPQMFKQPSFKRNLWNQISAKSQAKLASSDSPQPEFPFCHLRTGTIFLSQSLTGTAK